MFTALLDLSQTASNSFDAPPAPDKGERIFGGQFLAQSLCAAYRTVEKDRVLHSLHAYFLRPGDVDAPVELKVESVRDGRAFSSRQVTAHQADKERFRVMASFQYPDETPEYARMPMPDVPPPEAVNLSYDEFHLRQTGEDEWHGMQRPMDILYINPPPARGVAVTEDQLMWMRIREPLPDDPAVHIAGLAYLSDSAVVDHVMLPHGLRWQDEDFVGASLDHSMWFHQPARADEWLLFVQAAEATGRGRGLASGRFFDRRGQLVATCVQEGLMRWQRDD